MRDDDNEDDDQLSREEIAERYGFKPGEREAIEREMSERQARIDTERSLAEAREAAAARFAARRREPDIVTKSHQPAPAVAAPPSMTREWQRYIREQLDRRERIMLKAIGGVAGDEVRERERVTGELAKTNTELTARVAKLETELAEFRGELKTRSALAEMTERIDRLEAGKAAPLRAVG